MNNIEQYKNRFFNLMESTIGDVKPLISEQTNTVDELTLENINEKFNKLVFPGMEYRGSVGGEKLTGVIVLTSEFSSMNKRNNWNYPESIDINFSSAKKIEVTPEIENKIKGSKISSLNNPVKSDFSKITFAIITQESGLFGNEISSGKVQSNSILIRCTQGADTLFIFKSIDNNWHYVNITYS
jgi:hypothetical protein